MKNRPKNREGSILIVMTLIMIVAALYLTTALFDVRGTIDQERLYKTKKQMTYLQNAIADYRINNPTVPIQNFEYLISYPGSGALSSCFLSYSQTFTTMQYPRGWCGPYLDTSLFLGTSSAYKEDAWGTPMVLSSTGVSGDYHYYIRSCGEDLTCGNADDVPIDF